MKSKDGVQIKDFLVTDYCTGGPDVTIREVIQCFVKKHMNIYVVTNEDGTIQGVMTLFDVLKDLIPFYLQIDTTLSELAYDNLLSDEKIGEVLCSEVSELMTEDVVTVQDEDFFLEAASKMLNYNFDYLPVLDKDNKCVGVVTRNAIEECLLGKVKVTCEKK